MRAALGCLQQRVRAGEAHLQSLVVHLEAVLAQPFDFRDEVPPSMLAGLEERERLTLQLVQLYPRATLCQMALKASPERQAQRLRMGIEAAQQAAQVGLVAHDPAVAAFFFGLQAQGLDEARQLEASRQAWGISLQLYRELARARPEVYRPDEALTLNNLGIVQRALNDLEGARTSHEKALAIRRKLAQVRPKLYRPDVALSLNNLGNVQRVLNDLKGARASHKEALAIRRKLARRWPKVYRPEVAQTLNNLGNVQRALNDLGAARTSLQAALAMQCELAQGRPSVYRPLMATTLNNLGIVQRDLRDLDAARASFQKALAIYRKLARARPEVYRPDVAMTLNNLGNVQRDLNDLKAARASLRKALEIRCQLARKWPKIYRPLVARTLNNLGNVQRDLNELEAARASYKRALAIRQNLARSRPNLYRPLVATTLNNLGNVQRALNELEAARASFEKALAIQRELAEVQPEVHQPLVATTLNNLGNVQRDLNDLETARDSFKKALAIRRKLARARPKVYRPDVAMTLNNLGTVQRALRDLQAARVSHQQALAIRRDLAQARPKVYRSDVAMTLNNLGNVQRDLNALKAARASFEEALAIRRKLARAWPKIYRPDVAMTLNNLGNVQRDLKDLGAARASFAKALVIRREFARSWPEVYRPLVAATLNNLGNIQRASNNLAAARASYEEAGRLYAQNAAKRPTARLLERQHCLFNLGALLRQESRRLAWPDYCAAREALRQARHCTEQFRGCFDDPAQRQRVQAESAEVYVLLARTCLDLWDVSGRKCRPDSDRLREAVETAEAGRARQLLDLLADELLTPNLPPEEKALAVAWQWIHRQYQQAGRWLHQEEEREARGEDATTSGEIDRRGSAGEDRRLVRRGLLEHSSPSEFRRPASATARSAPAPAVANAVARARELFERRQREHDKALAAIRRFHPEFNPDQPVAPVKLKELRAQLPADVPTGLVQFTVDREGGLVLVVTREKVLAVRLPEVGEEWLQEHGSTWFKNYVDRFRNASAGAKSKQPHDDWNDAVVRLLEPLATRVVRPLVRGLAGLGLKRLVLAPHRALHVFPLHACAIGEGCYFGDAFEILYTPSLSMWHRCACRQRETPQEVLLIQNPTLDDALHFTDVEGAGVARRFQPNVRTFRGLAARKEVLLEQGKISQVWHYCGHARFDPKDPLRSALILGGMSEEVHGDKWLTLRDVFTRLHLPQNSLSILNGCESGMLMPEVADDYVNLPTGFLYAGARCAVSTLWEVNDLSSALVMEKFYALWRGDGGAKPLGPAAALREAVRWLRDDIHSGTQVAQVLVPDLLIGVADSTTRALCEAAAKQLELQYPNQPPFADRAHWAPFICSGVGY